MARLPVVALRVSPLLSNLSPRPPEALAARASVLALRVSPLPSNLSSCPPQTLGARASRHDGKLVPG